MIVVQLNGGLGNQLFQYALGRRISIDRRVELCFDMSSFDTQIRRYKLDHFNVKGSPACETDLEYFFWWKKNNIFAKVYRKWDANKVYYQRRYVKEQSTVFDENIFQVSGNAYLSGYWQSEKYFKEIRTILCEDLTVNTPLSGSNLEMANLIDSSLSVSLHVRRGDYVTNPSTNQTHGVLPLEYYEAAAKLLLDRFTKPTFFIFSDDIHWAKENLRSIPAEKIFVDHNSEDMDFEDLRLMSRCQHHILANSSFSWWGAWLNQNNEKIVIAPRKWYSIDVDTRDLLPEEWIRL